MHSTPTGLVELCPPRAAYRLIRTACVAAWPFALLVGCAQPTPPSAPQPAAVAEPAAGQPAVAEPTGTEPVAAEPVAATRETWDALYVGGTHAGRVHTWEETVVRDGQALVKTTSDTRLRIARYGDAAEMRVHTEAYDTPDGRLQSFTHRTEAGGTPIVLEGTVQPDGLLLTTRSAGKETTTRMPWDPAQGGFFAVEQSLRRAPLQPGEERTVTLLMPELAGVRVATVTLTAQPSEPTALLDGTATLVPVTQRLRSEGLDLDGTCWTDPDGEILKSALPALQQETFRTTRDRAERYGREAGFDLGFDTVVRIDTPLPHPHTSHRGVYEATLAHKNPVDVFASGASQQVEPLDDHRAQISVRAIRPGEPPSVPAEPPPTDADRQPSHLIQSDDATVVQLAARIAPESRHPWQTAQALERWVHETITRKDYTQGFATAADVAQTLAGDCTEHAVLLAALCRARQIPARVCVGLVYVAAEQGFAFHMWNEVWIDDRWVPLDATIGRGGIGAAHVKLRHTDLAGDQGEAALLSVLDVMHQLQLRVIAFE